MSRKEMDRKEINQKRMEQPEAKPGETLADPEVVGRDEDQATGSEGAGRLVGLGEDQKDRDEPGRKSDAPRRLPE